MEKFPIIEKLFSSILLYSYLLPVAAFLLLARKSRNKAIFVLITYCSVFFLLGFFFNSIYLRYPGLLPIYNTCYTFLECFSFAAILYLNITTRQFKIGLIAFVTFFGIFQLFFLFYTRNKVLDSIPIGIETIFIYICIFLFFYESFNNVKDGYIYDDYCFWISIGLMIYLGGSFFFNILINHISDEEVSKYWFLTYIIDTSKNILLTVAVVVHARQKSKHQISNQNIPYLDFN